MKCTLSNKEQLRVLRIVDKTERSRRTLLPLHIKQFISLSLDGASVTTGASSTTNGSTPGTGTNNGGGGNGSNSGGAGSGTDAYRQSSSASPRGVVSSGNGGNGGGGYCGSSASTPHSHSTSGSYSVANPYAGSPTLYTSRKYN